jgi:hypothetical protein
LLALLEIEEDERAEMRHVVVEQGMKAKAVVMMASRMNRDPIVGRVNIWRPSWCDRMLLSLFIGQKVKQKKRKSVSPRRKA